MVSIFSKKDLVRNLIRHSANNRDSQVNNSSNTGENSISENSISENSISENSVDDINDSILPDPNLAGAVNNEVIMEVWKASSEATVPLAFNARTSNNMASKHKNGRVCIKSEESSRFVCGSSRSGHSLLQYLVWEFTVCFIVNFIYDYTDTTENRYAHPLKLFLV